MVRYSPRGAPRFIKFLHPGDTIRLSTVDPVTHPLPHPLLWQLHALLSRVMALKAAAGYPVLSCADGWGSDSGEGEDVDDLIEEEWEWGGEAVGGDHMRFVASAAIPGAIPGAWGARMPLDTKDTMVEDNKQTPTTKHPLAGDNEDGDAADKGEDEGEMDKPRLVTVVQGEYKRRMDEMWRKMEERLGRPAGVGLLWRT